MMDLSKQDPAHPPLQNTCGDQQVTNADPVAGVPENRPNTRYVFVGKCDTIYEVRILDADSDKPRVTVTCENSGGP